MSSIAPSIPISGTPSGSGGGDNLWVLHAPCGCRSGWLARAIPGLGEILDAPMAWQLMPYGRVRVERMHAEGFHWQFETATSAYSGTGDCPHTPLYGSKVLMVPDGFTWAISSVSDTIEHLVPCTDVDMVEYQAFGYAGAKVAPLCSTEASAPWWHATRADPCPDCELCAEDLPTVVPAT